MYALFDRPDKDIDGDGKGSIIQLHGTGLSVWGTERIDAPEEYVMKDIFIDWGTVEAYVDEGNTWIIQASPTGEFAGEQAEAMYSQRGWHPFSLDLTNDPDFDGISTFYIKLMGSNPGSYQRSHAGPITVIGTYELVPVPGDTDLDADVDLVDLGALAGNYGTGVSAPLDFAADWETLKPTTAEDVSADEANAENSKSGNDETISPVPGGGCNPIAIILILCMTMGFLLLGSTRSHT